MPFTVVQTQVWGGFPSVRVFLAGANDVEFLATSTGSVWLDGAPVLGPNLGLFLGQAETWCRFACVAADDLWAYSSRDVTVTVLVRNGTP